MSRMDTKGLGKAARKLAKAGKLPAGFELRPVLKRERDGRKYRPPTARDPMAEMLKARCRRWGMPHSKLGDMRDPWWGCEAGGAMALAMPRLAERKAYWDAICWMRRTVVNFDRAIGAPSRHAQCLRLMLPISPTETDASAPAPDERSDEQKQDDAVLALQWLEECIGRAGPAAATECRRVVLDDQKARDIGGMLSALRHISCFIDPSALT